MVTRIAQVRRPLHRYTDNMPRPFRHTPDVLQEHKSFRCRSVNRQQHGTGTTCASVRSHVQEGSSCDGGISRSSDASILNLPEGDPTTIGIRMKKCFGCLSMRVSEPRSITHRALYMHNSVHLSQLPLQCVAADSSSIRFHVFIVWYGESNGPLEEYI